jgi:hypothetical protein
MQQAVVFSDSNHSFLNYGFHAKYSNCLIFIQNYERKQSKKQKHRKSQIERKGGD